MEKIYKLITGQESKLALIGYLIMHMINIYKFLPIDVLMYVNFN